ncbi:PDDEXK nuclease domain-containing protein [Arthrobacter sp. MA-N2]|uniref:PDDEXK nuclease domain-containing protein n=1 Tax=Arthrobacter sp. MA-N2 TaxID=1101188 RepID=UPI001E4F3BBA|nr:PDDEXK nuclease domain-containing protein [Arthrobacter sp. MA-N2]
MGLSGAVAERALELALTSRITETLRELGPGFSFVGRQVHFDVDGDDYFIDMLFFHMDQNRFNCTSSGTSVGTNRARRPLNRRARQRSGPPGGRPPARSAHPQLSVRVFVAAS